MSKASNRTPWGARKSPTCNKCGLPIKFAVLPSGKYCPVNLDGSDHWDDCSVAVRKGRPFDPARDMKSSGVIVGSLYVEQMPMPEGEAPWN